MDQESPGGRWTAACTSASIPEGNPAGLTLAGLPVAFYKVGGRIYASHDECTHARALLSEGYLDGHVIECPLHGAMYDVRDGRCLAVADCPLATYPVREENGMISVLLPLASPQDDGAAGA